MNQRQRDKRSKNNPSNKIEKEEPKKKSSAGYMMDMFVNAMARTGMPAQNLMNTTEYECN